MHNSVEFLQEVNSNEVFSAAVNICKPLAVFTVVVEVEHRRNGVNSNAVNVVLVKPEHSR